MADEGGAGEQRNEKPSKESKEAKIGLNQRPTTTTTTTITTTYSILLQGLKDS